MSKTMRVLGLVFTVAALGWMAGCGGSDDGNAGGGLSLSGTWIEVDLTTAASGTWTLSQNGTALSGSDGGDPLTGTIDASNVIALDCRVGPSALPLSYAGSANAAGTRINGTWNNPAAGRSGPFVAVKRRDGGSMALNGRWKIVDVVPGTGAALDFNFTQTGNTVNGVNALDSNDTYTGTLDGSTLNLAFVYAGVTRGTVTGQMLEGGNLMIGTWTDTATGANGGIVFYLND